MAARERPDIASRIAWTYLGSLMTLAVAGLVTFVAHTLIGVFGCQIDDAELKLVCQLGWDVLAFVIAFVASFGIAVKAMKLDVWAWLGLILVALSILMFGRVWDWWWWVLVIGIPAFTALLSAQWWPKPPGRTVHHGILIGLAVGAVVLSFYWYVFG